MLSIVLLGLALGVLGCKSRVVTPPAPPEPEVVDANAVLKQLVEAYKNGQVSRCFYEGKAYYFGARNAHDTGAEVFDERGKKVGVCYYATNRVDAICEQAKDDCKDMYRVHPNIWGLEGIELKLDE